MKHFAIILGSLMALSNPAVSDTINITVPSAVADRIDVYRLECANEGGQIELDGDEISKLWTDEGEEAYIIHAAFTCSGHGHMWCGTMGCPTDFVIYSEHLLIKYLKMIMVWSHTGRPKELGSLLKIDQLDTASSHQGPSVRL
jgi:hypothetical protein